jgi:hypothetical protein
MQAGGRTDVFVVLAGALACSAGNWQGRTQHVPTQPSHRLPIRPDAPELITDARLVEGLSHANSIVGCDCVFKMRRDSENLGP